ncbi:MAG TPA: hypothetical protein VFZ09_00920 [Archangium sp.]|uniref:hypothetical protein n=1 Tax=Archangium sp. TaxID=1872627 RepID=UPI002E364E6E|nr:hypothetical protein [Archangium sp.]HEX5744769.1 hypothetical protein [Archangium sp.]
MIPVVMALSMLLSSIPSEGRAPSSASLPSTPGVSLLEPRDTHPAFNHSLLAQAGASPRKTYKKFLIIRQGGERIEGSEGVLQANRLTGKTLSGESVDMAVGDIKTLYSSQGSPVGSGALWGGVTGLVVTGVCALPLLSIPHFFSYDGAILGTAIGLGAGTLIGAGLGAWIGSMGDGWQVEPIVAPGKLYVLQLTFKV